MSPTRKPQRRTLYVSRAIQGRLLKRLCVYWMLYHLCLWHGMFLMEGLSAGLQVESLGELYVAFFWQHLSLPILAFSALPMIFYDLLKFSNRIAGPFVRFERALKAMTRGERVERLSLRDGDLVGEFLLVFNEYVDARNCEFDIEKMASEVPDTERSETSQEASIASCS